MNQKAFAIFIGAIMVISAFAGFMFRGLPEGSGEVIGTTSDETPSTAFGMGGRMIEWNFNSLADMLETAPENVTYAYWVNLQKSQNITDVAQVTLPQSAGLIYKGSSLYSNNIERLGVVFMEGSGSVEYHWIKPYNIGFQGMTVPYDDFQMIPVSQGMYYVLGKPILFGQEKSVKSVLDVIAGGLPTDKFSIVWGESADIQLAALGGSSQPRALLGGGYDVFYLGASQDNSTCTINAKYLKPTGDTVNKVEEIAGKYGLSLSSKEGLTVVTGSVELSKLGDALKAFVSP
jgi:hypothetical protein